MIINIDMDGVLANFDKRKLEILNGREEPLNSKDFWVLLKEDPYLYRDLEPMPDAVDLINGILDLLQVNSLDGYCKCPLVVLTAIPKASTMPDAEAHKREWLSKQEFSFLSHKFKIGPYASDKWKHCYHRDDILIDDNKKNIEDWVHNGKGIGIFHISAEKTIKALEEILSIR